MQLFWMFARLLEDSEANPKTSPNCLMSFFFPEWFWDLNFIKFLENSETFSSLKIFGQKSSAVLMPRQEVRDKRNMLLWSPDDQDVINFPRMKIQYKKTMIIKKGSGALGDSVSRACNS